jgi:hypothetical protein
MKNAEEASSPVARTLKTEMCLLEEFDRRSRKMLENIMHRTQEDFDRV